MSSSLLLRNLLLKRTMSSSSSLVKKLDGKTAIVTASTDGIGYAIADRLLNDGAQVMISSRKQDNVNNSLKSLQERYGTGPVRGVVCHVGKDEDRKRLISEVSLEEKTVSQFGKLNILVSNAAVNPSFGPTLETSDSAWDKIFEINVKAAALLVKEAYPHLKETCGNIVFVSSIGGYSPFSLLGAYSVSKTALLGLTKALAVELAPDNIRVNCLAPGIIKTRFSSALWSNETIAEEAMKNIPLNRFGETKDCAGAVSFMCSDDASYMTGETITVAGGMRSRL